jgi:AsmA protein
VATTIRRALNNDLISPNARTPLTGMSAAFTMADGVMATESISFNTPDLRLRGLGVIDLAGRSLDLRLAPQGAILAIPFRAHGPWDRLQYAASLAERDRTALLARVRAVQAAARAPATP